MRLHASAVAVAALAIAAASLRAQTDEHSRDRLTPFAAASIMKYGPSAFGGLEMALNRWVALRAEGMVNLQQNDMWPDRFMSALSLSGVYSMRPDTRMSPYFFAGYAFSMSRHFAPEAGPLGGAGMRFRFGKVQPFVEFRAQHRLGTPISLGFRF